MSGGGFDAADARRIWTAVKEHADPSGELLSDVFMKVPSKKEYPEYYQVIPEPMDLTMVKVRSRTVFLAPKWARQ